MWEKKEVLNGFQLTESIQYLSLKKSISPRREATASKTMFSSQESGVGGAVGPG